METGGVELRVLGEPEVWVAGEALLLPPKRLGFVAYLALEGSAHPLRRGELAATFWGEDARGNLRQELHRLRGSPLAPFLTLDGEQVGVRGLWCDALAFEAAALAGELEVALGLYRGPLLDGLDVPHAPLFEDWLAVRRERLHTRWLDLRWAWANRRVEAGDARGALVALTPLLETANEAACLLAMRLHAGLGEPQAAGRVYTELCQALNELGLEPGPEVTALAGRLRGTVQPPAEPAPHRRASLERPPLVGRDALLERLERELEAGARLLLLEGEPGVGKSSLARALTERWGHGLRLQGDEEAQATPFLPVMEALRSRGEALGELPPVWRAEVARLLPEWGTDLPAPTDAHGEGRARFLEGLARAVTQATGGGGVLWLDDLHWFDPSTLEVLGVVLRGGGWRAVGTVRTRERRQNPALERLLQGLERRGQLSASSVPPLSETETLRLLRALSPSGTGGTRFARRLHGGTGGNPLFLLEMLRTLLATGQMREEGGQWHTDFDSDTADYRELPLPPSVAGAVLARIARLAVTAGRALPQLLGAAALLGDGFALEELSGSLPLDDWALLDLLEQAVDAGLLVRGEDGRYRFSHGLVGRTVLEHLGPDRRRFLHRRLALTLTRLGLPPARLAPHLEGGGETQAAARAWLAAAGEAVRVYAHREALLQLDRALSLGLPPDEALDAHWQRVAALRTLDDREGWRAALDAVEALSPPGPRLALHRLELDFQGGRYAEVLEGVRTLRESAALSGEDEGWAGLWAANALSRLSRLPEAVDTYASALGAAPETALELRGRLHNGWAYAASQAGDLEVGQAKVEAALACFTACGHRKGLAMAHNTAGALLYMAERDAEAAGQYRRAYALAVEIGDRTSERLALTSLSAVYLVLEDFEAALEATNRALELLADWPDPYTECLMYERLALVYRARGQRERQIASLRRCMDRADEYHYPNLSADSRLSLLESLLQVQGGENDAECVDLFATLPALLAACPETQRRKKQIRLDALTVKWKTAAEGR